MGHFYTLRSDPKRCVRKCRQRGGEKRREGRALQTSAFKKLSLRCARAHPLFPLEIRSRRLVCHKRPKPNGRQWAAGVLLLLPLFPTPPASAGLRHRKRREKRREEDASLLSVWGVGKVCLTYYSSRLRRRLISNYASPLILFWASVEFPGGGR